MLKYGGLSTVNNVNSKSLVPRNLTYRQNDIFKSTVSSSDIITAIQSNSFVIPNASNITSDSGNFNNSSIANLSVDLITQKTTTLPYIQINAPINITDQTSTVVQSFKFNFNEDSTFEGTSLDVNVGNISFRDNIVYINSKFNDTIAGPNETSYDSYLSGFMFPNNNQDSTKKRTYNGMIIIPAKTYLNNDSINLKFSEYTSDIYQSTQYTNTSFYMKFTVVIGMDLLETTCITL